MSDAQAPAASPRAVGFVFVTVVLDALAIGVILPVLPKLVLTLGGGGAAATALAYGSIATVFAVMQVLASPVLGALSDRFGRRPIILASNLSLGADFVVMALAPALPWLFLGRLLSGAAAGSGAAAYAYLADTTAPERRAGRFGLMFAAQAVGAALGPALGGLAGAIDLRAPFWIAAALCLANAAYGLFVLPESLPKRRRAPLDWSQMNPAGALIWLVRAYPALAAMVAAAFLLSLASQGVNNVAAVYAMFRYRWGPAQIGLFLTGFGALSLAVQATLVSPAARRLGERGAMAGALSLTVAGLMLCGVARTGLVFTLAIPLLALGQISGPMMGSMFSNTVAEDEQGRLQGAWASVNSLMGLAAPALFTLIFAQTALPGSAISPGAPFFAAAAMIALAIGLTLRRR